MSRRPTGPQAVLLMLRSANGGSVTFRYLEAGLVGLGAKRTEVLVSHAVFRARLLLRGGEGIVLVPMIGYRHVPGSPP